MSKFVLSTKQFKTEMFISDIEKTSIPVTEDINEAFVFDLKKDNPNIKVGYYKAVTGYNLEVKNLS